MPPGKRARHGAQGGVPHVARDNARASTPSDLPRSCVVPPTPEHVSMEVIDS
jgi:hypothetical protein